MFLFDCTGLLPIYQAFCDGLIDSLHILYLSNFEELGKCSNNSKADLNVL